MDISLLLLTPAHTVACSSSSFFFFYFILLFCIIAYNRLFTFNGNAAVVNAIHNNK